MKLKVFSTTATEVSTPKDRHLELFFLMICMSVALVYAHVSIVSDLNSQIRPSSDCSTGCQNVDNSDGLVSSQANETFSNAYEKNKTQPPGLQLQQGSPLTMWIVHNFGAVYTSVAVLVIVFGCTCSKTPSLRRSS